MSKKDFQALARAMFQAKDNEERNGTKCSVARRYPCAWPGASCRTHKTVLDRAVAIMADTLADANPRFNRALFIEACETGRCKGMKERVS